jgi:Uma2 family endonuclease
MIATKWYVTSERRVAMTMISDEEETKVVMPADWVPGPRQGDWTYEMYSALPDDGRHYEVVQGVLMMSPAPEMAHQGIIQRISRYLDEQIFSTNRGLVFTGPVDVVLESQKVVQPDVLVLLENHLDRLQEKSVEGAPDLVVEVISPSSATYDRLVKHNLYEQEGIPEYWLINPKEQSIEVFVLEMGKYRSLGAFRNEQIVQSYLVPNETVQAAHFFSWAGKFRKSS